MPKTHKSILKRMKITKRGSIVRRGTGLNHFLAKRKRSKQLSNKRSHTVAKATQPMIRSYLYR